MTVAKTKRRLSEAERAERRRRDRERLQRAAQELLTSEGWRRWVRVRAMFHSYSAGNCMLIALQCHERGIVPEHVAGFRTWLRLGRCIRKRSGSRSTARRSRMWSGWGEDGALEAVTEFAEAIDEIARRIEDVLQAFEQGSLEPADRAA